MKRIMLDTNIVLDALLERDPWVAEARTIWSNHLRSRIAAHITASSLSDIFYVSRRLADRARAWLAVGTCLDQLYVIPVALPVLQAAARLGGGDFEDNLQMASAVAANLDAIVTRDPAGFRVSPVPVLTPAQLIAQLATTEPGTV
jgi:predicted nucleic acid-binding protein